MMTVTAKRGSGDDDIWVNAYFRTSRLAPPRPQISGGFGDRRPAIIRRNDPRRRRLRIRHGVRADGGGEFETLNARLFNRSTQKARLTDARL
jgi:hypothetical protein